ncbi:MAG: hypothetical protein ACTMIR_07340 [Cellulomonadaceae bacterium]
MNDFTTSEGLRALLARFANPDDPTGWTSTVGTELARYCMHRFAPLARKHRQPVEDGAAFAFEAMCAPSLLRAVDPWAVVTTAVQRSFVAQFTGDSLLCGDRAARHAVDVHDPQRICDRDWTFLEAGLLTDDVVDDSRVKRTTKAGDVAPVEMQTAIAEAVRLFRAFGWPGETATFALEYIAGRLELAGNPATAFEYLRRDRMARGRLDLDQRAWTRLLTVVLGSPDNAQRLIPRNRGLLVRLVAGGVVEEFIHDDTVVLALSTVHSLDWEASHV